MNAIFSWLVLNISVLILSSKNCSATKLNEAAGSDYGVSLNITSNYVVMDNGILQVTIANPGGFVVGIRYNGVDNLLEIKNKEANRGYFDVVWDAPGRCNNTATSVGCSDLLSGKSFRIIRNDSNSSEISFSGQWDKASWNNTESPAAPVNIDRRYVMFKGLAGFHSYIVLDHDASYPEANIRQIRAVYKLDSNRFPYMAISDDMQRLMPMPQDRETGEVLAYKEAVLLVDPVNPDMKGEVDDKYQYEMEDKDNKLHGWIADSNQTVGFWMITPSNEFRSAGPFKVDLTSHVGPTCLQMFHSAHYAGKDLVLAFKQGEAWKKVFGPFLVYLNSNNSNGALWRDAKRQMMQETMRWPYDFPLSLDFASPIQRGSVSGRLLVKDRFGKSLVVPAANAWVGLVVVGEAGSWQVETKGYQFWVQANENGSFLINGVIVGNYSLYATVPGFIGDYKYATDIWVTPVRELKLGDLTYEPPRNGPTLWEIGIPDRTAAEFFVPNPNPRLVNKLFLNKPQDNFRQYGLWEQYTRMYSNGDLVYIIGKSDFRRDWFFAHGIRREGKILKPTTWKIVFPLANSEAEGNYTLRIAVASASYAEVQVRFNDPAKAEPDFTTNLFGKDNAIARHGIHGLYWLFNVDVPSASLRGGTNTIYLTQTRCKSVFDGVMYDYIRLKGPDRLEKLKCSFTKM